MENCESRSMGKIAAVTGLEAGAQDAAGYYFRCEGLGLKTETLYL